MKQFGESGERVDFYAFLSRMFLEEPPRELADDIASSNFHLPEMPASNKDFDEGILILRKFMKTEKDADKMFESMCTEYTRLFLGPAPCVFPYESMYINGSMMGKSLLSVKKEYMLAGLTKAAGFYEPEDHIAMELQFMSYLCKDGSKKGLQKDFLDKHLLKWTPGFCDELSIKSRSDFYRGMGKLLKGFLVIDKEILDRTDLDFLKSATSR